MAYEKARESHHCPRQTASSRSFKVVNARKDLSLSARDRAMYEWKFLIHLRTNILPGNGIEFGRKERVCWEAGTMEAEGA